MKHPVSEEHYRSLFAEHPNAVFGLDLGGRFVEVNPAAGRISGHSPEKLLGMNFVDLIEPADLERTAAALEQVLQRRPQQLELRIRRADGGVAELAVTGMPWVVGEEVQGLYGIAEDVTERNRTARELEVTRQVAVTASLVKSDFVARMSHEIRTPLTSILATIELLDDTEPSQEQQQLITTLQRSGARLLRLVDSVLDFAATESVEPPATEEFDLHAAVHDAVALVESAARRRGLHIGLDLADDVPRWVRNHPTWTSQILVNLLSNAVDHTDEGRIEVAVTTTTTAASETGILYRISDTGVGIGPEHQRLIFEPFTRVPSVGRRTAGRTGLGLSIVKQLVTLSGGTIALDSAPGRGSTFFVLMPVTPVEAPA